MFLPQVPTPNLDQPSFRVSAGKLHYLHLVNSIYTTELLHFPSRCECEVNNGLVLRQPGHLFESTMYADTEPVEACH